MAVFGAAFAHAGQASFLAPLSQTAWPSKLATYAVGDGKCAGDGGIWAVVKIIEPCDTNDGGMIGCQDASDLPEFPLRAEPALSGNADCNPTGMAS
jgi:hypothetical protein